MPLTNRYADLDMTFAQHPLSKDVTRKFDAEAIKRSVKLLIMTTPGEKPFRPDFGSSVRKLLFEPISHITTYVIQQEIAQVIRNFEPRVDLRDVIVEAEPDDNAYRIHIIYNISNTSEPVKIDMILQRVR